MEEADKIYKFVDKERNTRKINEIYQLKWINRKKSMTSGEDKLEKISTFQYSQTTKQCDKMETEILNRTRSATNVLSINKTTLGQKEVSTKM